MKLTKLLLITSFLTVSFTSISLNAQNIGVGVITGFTESNHNNNFVFITDGAEIDIEPSFRSNFHAGVVLRKILHKNFRIQAEPQFIQLGASYEDDFIYNNFSFNLIGETTLRYVQVPLLFQITTTPPDRREFPRPWPEFTYHFGIGGYGGYLIDAQFSGEITGAPIGIGFENDFSENVTNQYDEWDAGLILGGGLEFGLKRKIGLETKTFFGLISTGDLWGYVFSPKNVGINISLYYIL